MRILFSDYLHITSDSTPLLFDMPSNMVRNSFMHGFILNKRTNFLLTYCSLYLTTEIEHFLIYAILMVAANGYEVLFS